MNKRIALNIGITKKDIVLIVQDLNINNVSFIDFMFWYLSFKTLKFLLCCFKWLFKMSKSIIKKDSKKAISGIKLGD